MVQGIYHILITINIQMKKQDEEISYATNKKNLIKFKIVFIGDQNVGKSSIITRFIKDEFDTTHHPTVGIDFVSKNIVLNGQTIRLQLWDTAGQERFRSLIPGYLRDSQAAFVVYDITNKESYENVARWIDFVKEFRGDEAVVYVLGNKADLSDGGQKQGDGEKQGDEEKGFGRTVSLETAKDRFQKMGTKFMEVSAKTGANLQELFKNACVELVNLPTDQIGHIQFKSSVAADRSLQKKPSLKETVQLKKSKLLNPNKTKQNRTIQQKNCC